MKHHFELKTDRTYKTYDGAVKAADKFLEEMKDALESEGAHPIYTIGATRDGRFAPVFARAGVFMVHFAHKGFTVVQ